MKTWMYGLCLGLVTSAALASPDLPVQTRQGLVSGTGTRVEGVLAYHGIPYAAPPVGAARWRAPSAPESWDGIRDGSRFGNRCMQTRPFDDMIWNSEKESEDCLYLSVWAPEAREGLPVMVWIHGGGFASGSGGEARHDGSHLASEGVVVVTLNYRLGVFGFLAHPDLTRESGHSGNYGLLDVIAALQWVRDNIEAFGGNPGNATIFGESAGSFAVSALMSSPLGHGLFHRAIGQSGAMFETSQEPFPGQREADSAGAAFAQALGAASISEMRALPPTALVTASIEQEAQFRPVIDHYLLPESPNAIFREGRQNDVPLLVGWNSAETKWVSMGLNDFLGARKQHFPNNPEQAARLYPASNDDEARRMGIALFSDFFLVYRTWKWAESQRASGDALVFRYLFDQVQADKGAEVPVNDPGAAHATDIPYVFDTLDYLGKPVSEGDRQTARLMMRYWARFARSGNPNAAGLPEWPPYSEETGFQLMRFKAGGAAEADAGRERLEFVDTVLAPKKDPEGGG